MRRLADARVRKTAAKRDALQRDADALKVWMGDAVKVSVQLQEEVPIYKAEVWGGGGRIEFFRSYRNFIFEYLF
jgi:hypothetical protein